MIRGSSRVFQGLWQNSRMIGVFLLIFLLLSIFIPYFFTWRNLVGLALSITTIGLVASTMMFVMAVGDIDLSVGSTVAFSGVLTAVLINMTGSYLLGIITGLLFSGLLGWINGFIIARLRLNPLIVTLAMMQIIRGIGFIISGGRAVGIKEVPFFSLGNGLILGVPIPIWITMIMFIFVGVLLNNTAFGRYSLAIGGNKEAANLTGINVEKIKTIIFTFQGFVAGLAGIILAARMTSGQPNAAQGFELNVISACILGGVSLKGGYARITGVIVGVFIMGTVQNAMNLVNIPTFYQYIVRGLILLIAVMLDKIKVDN